MSNLKELKNRIKSIKATQKLTKAMQMVAASKLKKAREEAENSSPYIQALETTLAEIADNLKIDSNSPKLLTGTGKHKEFLLIVCCSEKGLCGSFNAALIKKLKEKISFLEKQHKKVKIITIGKKAQDALKYDYKKYIIKHFASFDKNVDFKQSLLIRDYILELFKQDKFDVANIIFNKFKNALTQVPSEKQIIPMLLDKNEQKTTFKANYKFEPSKNEVLEQILPMNLNLQIFNCFVESFASEQGARMTAMENATKNANNIIDDLTLIFNRNRQANITKELIEIISGAEAI